MVHLKPKKYLAELCCSTKTYSKISSLTDSQRAWTKNSQAVYKKIVRGLLQAGWSQNLCFLTQLEGILDFDSFS